MDKESNIERARRLIGKEFNLKPPSMEISIGGIEFLNEAHRQKFTDYCQKAHIHRDDRERKAMFYILSGSPDIISKGINRMYDFKENIVKFSPVPEEQEKDFQPFNFCSSSHALLKLALNLYNSTYESLSVADTFYNLDSDNKQLAINAMRIRFNIE
jgi:hypothetical protein